MKSLLSQIVFTVDRQSFDWADVLLSARLRGGWRSLVTVVRQSVACVQHAHQTRAFPRRVATAAAAEEFRLERDLTAAADMLAWLAQRGISPEAWMHCVRASVVRNQWSDQLADLVRRYPASRRDVYRRFRSEGFCLGLFDRWAWQLAGRVAADDGLSHQAPARHTRLPGLPADQTLGRCARLNRIEAAFAEYCRKLLTPIAVGRQINNRPLDWIRFECVFAAFGDESVAREVIMCVREDGDPFDEVVIRAGSKPRSARLFLEEVDPDIRLALLGARPGDLLGPLRWQQELRLILVRSKVLPTESDPEIRARAERAILTQTLDHRIAERVKWRANWPRPSAIDYR